MAQPRITIIKSFLYRDDPEEFGNTYHFVGTKPTDLDGWKTLADAIIAAEKTCYTNRVSFVRAYGYAAGASATEAVIDYETLSAVVTGTSTGFTAYLPPGDIAATCRWPLDRFNSKGKRIYLRKYYHGVWGSTTDNDKLVLDQLTLLQTFGNKLIDGTLPGSFRYSDDHGNVPLTTTVSPWLTTRTLKRRGRRPPG